MRRGQGLQIGHLGVLKSFAETDRESSFSQRRSLVVGEGPVKGERTGAQARGIKR